LSGAATRRARRATGGLDAKSELLIHGIAQRRIVIPHEQTNGHVVPEGLPYGRAFAVFHGLLAD
jgi:hypothetical protein